MNKEERQKRIAEIKTLKDLVTFVREDLEGDYTIALHGIPQRKVRSPYNDPVEVAERILDTELKLNGSIPHYENFAMPKGKVKDADVSTFRYNYMDCSLEGISMTLHNIILAIPDRLETNDKFVPLFPMSSKLGDQSMYDVIFKDKKVVPTQYIYGYYSFMPSTNETIFISNDNHISQITKEEYEKYVAEIEQLFLEKVGYSQVDLNTISRETKMEALEAKGFGSHNHVCGIKQCYDSFLAFHTERNERQKEQIANSMTRRGFFLGKKPDVEKGTT